MTGCVWLQVNLMDFVKLFNARTAKYVEGIPLPVKLQTFDDRSFEFQVSTPVSPTSVFRTNLVSEYSHVSSRGSPRRTS